MAASSVAVHPMPPVVKIKHTKLCFNKAGNGKSVFVTFYSAQQLRHGQTPTSASVMIELLVHYDNKSHSNWYPGLAAFGLARVGSKHLDYIAMAGNGVPSASTKCRPISLT
ncbi:hypothetical protein V7S43_005209 [Phytophthora oleae]|uniref:Uncharacterized protein n=1 Tax=Phytophthora oleae TaxID=2107226 RepID=A0ABD3FV25_9STRA